MARLFTSGFEPQSITAGIEWDFLGSTPTIDTTTKRTGAAALKCTLASGIAMFLQYQFAPSASPGAGPYFFRVYINISVLPTAETGIIWFQQEAGSFLTCAHISLDNSGILRLYNENATGVAAQVAAGGPNSNGTSAALSTSTWYCILFKFDRSPAAGSQILEGKVGPDDGTTPTIFATASNLTIGNAPAVISVGGNHASQAVTGTLFYDDCALNDSTGTSQTTYPGIGKVLMLKPNAAGDVNTFATQTGGTAGSANNFTRVNEVTPNDATSFNGSNTLNQEDLFKMDASGIGASDTINVVEVNGRFSNNIADATTAIKFEIEKTAASTISQSAAIIRNSTAWTTNQIAVPRTAPLVTYQDPLAANWTQASVDTMQAGYKITTGGTNRIQVTKVWVSVDYTPAAVVVTKVTYKTLLGAGQI